MMPASEFLVALTITMTRIVVLLWLNGALESGRAANSQIDIPDYFRQSDPRLLGNEECPHYAWKRPVESPWLSMRSPPMASAMLRNRLVMGCSLALT